ncbi:MAG: hypothetical protein MAG795_01142 [Candidatus Woesearchaeota archaeon]|nr:hypothetical protein [Candidatus Woesearchaeota archaeon]
MSDINDLLENKSGIAIDLDETLSWTIYYWMLEAQKIFGNPENLTPEAMARKYRYTGNVPYWEGQEFNKWRMGKILCNETQRNLPPIKGSIKGLNNLNKIIPIATYLSCRPQAVIKGTKDWLKANNYPDAPITLRPSSVKKQDEQKWKAKKLESLYPDIVGIVDDNPNFIKAVSSDFKGVIFLYDRQKSLNTNLNIISCKDWDTVVRKAKEYFRK